MPLTMSPATTPARAATALKIASYGDSRSTQGKNEATTNGINGFQTTVRPTNNIVPWLPVVSQGRLQTPSRLDFGGPGQTSAQILARTSDVTASDADVVVMLGCMTNDLTTLTPAQSIANIAAMFQALTAVGKRVIYITESPRGSATVTAQNRTATQMSYLRQARQWAIDTAASAYPGVTVLDYWPGWVDYASSSGYARLALFGDGLHPDPAATIPVARDIWALLKPLSPTMPIGTAADPGDRYDATNNPRGSLFSNGVMQGTSGITKGGFTGNLATNLTVTTTGLFSSGTWTTQTIAKVVKNNAEWQQITLAGTAATGGSSSFYLQMPVTDVSAITAGKTLRVSALIEIDSGFTGFTGVSEFVGGSNTTDGSYQARLLLPPSGYAYALPDIGWIDGNAMMLTQDVTFPSAPSGAVSVNFQFWLLPGAVSLTARLTGLTARIVQ